MPIEDRVLVVGAGPSLKENLDDLERLGKFPGITIATDAAIQHLLGRGIVPDVGACLEDLPQLTKYFVPDIVKEKGHRIQSIWISDRVHRDVRKSMNDAGINELNVAAEVRKIGTSNVGLFSTAIAHVIYQCNEVHYVGMDHCYATNNPPPVPRSDPLFELGFYTIINPHIEQELVLNPAHELWREELHENMRLWRQLNIVNHTGFGAIFGERIKWQPLKDVNTWSETFM